MSPLFFVIKFGILKTYLYICIGNDANLKLFSMNNLFNGLQIVGGETKIVSISETASVEVSGKFSMEKGNFKQEFSYWARTYEKFGNYAKVDDFDTENHKCTLGELPIDSLGALKTTLTNSGLTTLANSLGFSSEEITNAMHQHIQEHKIFKAVYGKKVRLWDLLLSDEKELANLKFVVANYEMCSDYQKRECGINVYDEEGNVIPNGVPTKEVLEFVLGGIAN
jgi:hypothetical protein